jgi:DNA-binding protein HU-beta
MNQSELVDAISAKLGSGFPKTKVKEVLNAFQETVIRALKTPGEKVRLHGFGTFLSRQAAARTCVNPQTDEKMTVPAKVVPKFKPSSQFKSALK